MSSTTTPRTSTFSSPSQPNAREHNAALQGASSAFSKPPVKSKPNVNTHSANQGALAAASKAGRANMTGVIGSPVSTSSTTSLVHGSGVVRRNNTGGSSICSYTSSPVRVSHSSESTLGVPSGNGNGRSRSPSNIAAALAASRHTPVSNLRLSPQSASSPPLEAAVDVLPSSGTVGNLKAKLEALSRDNRELRSTVQSSHSQNGKYDGTDALQTTDATATSPTTSPVRLFEKNSLAKGMKTGTEPIQTNKSVPPPIKTPKPQYIFSLPVAVTPVPLPAPFQLDALSKPQPKPKPENILPTVRQKSIGQAPPSLVTHSIEPANADSDDDSPSAYVSAPETNSPEKLKPAVPPPRRGRRKLARSDTTTTQQAKPRLRSQPPTLKPSPSNHVARPAEMSRAGSTSSPYQRQSLRQIQPHMTGDSLANAIVASSVATSRLPSPAKSPPPLPARHSRSRNHHKEHHHHFSFRSRTPSPVKPRQGLRQTLRKEHSSSGDDIDRRKHKHKHGYIVRKHPNKHHEGDRKRWRDAITERERKRYEGVWAANRGLHIYVPATNGDAPGSHTHRKMIEGAQNDVLNLVVRDIWCRSRLPHHVLEEVWNLVDQRRIGRLTREEFVVGLWLIDQRLKGRKLPVKVGESVWASVRGVGVKVKVRRG
ncbi:hypothetical protein M501DRAFT_1005160 [Patellaria atrata CBS 101060]|uniref:EH domain-containing protein n=1 Tax=Patellaria atrata CBS 101060 TaxID=1346257 RepID=A0A9P4SB01_9PEZI|nr:hypothetical protein M501DRAFT_1005160 [Patellaria atrata CBS 101060]